MLDIPLQLVTCDAPSVSALKGRNCEIKEEQTFHFVHVTEQLVKGDYKPK
jgi:hypothetical protein